MSTMRVLLVHSLGLDAQAYAALRTALGAGVDLRCEDLRGHGTRASQTRFTLADLVDDVLESLADLPGPVHLVGHSMGGALAALAAARAGAQVASLALVATPAAGVPAFEERAVAAQRDMTASCEATLARWFEGETADTAESVATARRALARMRPQGLASAWRALASFEGYGAIAQPLPSTLCIAAANDASTPPSLMQRIVAARRERQPGAEIPLPVVPGAGHMVPLTHPAPVAALLAAHWGLSETRRRQA